MKETTCEKLLKTFLISVVGIVNLVSTKNQQTKSITNLKFIGWLYKLIKFIELFIYWFRIKKNRCSAKKHRFLFVLDLPIQNLRNLRKVRRRSLKENQRTALQAPIPSRFSAVMRIRRRRKVRKRRKKINWKT